MYHYTGSVAGASQYKDYTVLPATGHGIGGGEMELRCMAITRLKRLVIVGVDGALQVKQIYMIP